MKKVVIISLVIISLALVFGCTSNSGSLSPNNTAEQNKNDAFTFANNISTCTSTTFDYVVNNSSSGNYTETYTILSPSGDGCNIEIKFNTFGNTPDLDNKKIVCLFTKQDTLGTILPKIGNRDFVQNSCSGEAKTALLNIIK